MASAEVVFLGHSGFLVDTGDGFLLFDMYTDDAGVLSGGLPHGGKGAIFVSHRHADHFRRDIVSMGVSRKTTYVVDSGIRLGKTECEVRKMRPYDEANLGWASVKAYGSTDEGCSFLVNTSGLGIFHAGDLNDWYWEDESTQAELKEYEGNYLKELGKLAGNNVDIAFVPVDTRLGRNAFRGAMHFARIIKPTFLLPMHTNGRLDRDELPSLFHEEGLQTAVVYMSRIGEREILEP